MNDSASLAVNVKGVSTGDEGKMVVDTCATSGKTVNN